MNESRFTWPTEDPAHGRVLLRSFTHRDADMVMNLSTDPDADLGSVAAHSDRAQANQYIDRQHSLLTKGTGYSFCIANCDDDRALGLMVLWLTDISDGRVSVGYCVAPSARGHGVASQALIAVTNFAWTLPQVHRIEACIEPWNLASIRSAVVAGFESEGLLRSYTMVKDQRADMLMHAMLRPTTESAN